MSWRKNGTVAAISGLRKNQRLIHPWHCASTIEINSVPCPYAVQRCPTSHLSCMRTLSLLRACGRAVKNAVCICSPARSRSACSSDRVDDAIRRKYSAGASPLPTAIKSAKSIGSAHSPTDACTHLLVCTSKPAASRPRVSSYNTRKSICRANACIRVARAVSPQSASAWAQIIRHAHKHPEAAVERAGYSIAARPSGIRSGKWPS